MTIALSAPLKFLIVDDSRAIQAIIRRAVIQCGYEPLEIKTALDGEQALDIIEKFVPDLIITDWHMPKVSGLELVQALRQLGHSKVRVGFVTTEKNPALLDQAISNGALFILHKPFDDKELAEVVMASVKDLAKPVHPPVAADPAPAPAIPEPTPLPEAPAAVQAPAEPAPPPVPAKVETGPVWEAALHHQLQGLLGNLPFRLVVGDKLTQDRLTANNLLGLYGCSAVKGAYAVAVLDASAVCMVGGGAARKGPPEVRAAMDAGQPSGAMLEHATAFLHAIARSLTETSGHAGATVSLVRSSMVKSNFAKLMEILTQTDRRSDYRVVIPGYGEGRMAFFLVTT
ncbi:MAG: response regulator [Burkholderiales bacterium]|nr:response regulator [Rhodoferax sp.]MBK9347929.1 response regulator [Burkholderiales bacterium]